MKGLDFLKIFDSMKNNEINEIIIKEGSKVYEIRRGGFKHEYQSIPAQPVMHAVPQAAPVAVQPAASIQQSSGAAPAAAPKQEKKDEVKELSNLHELKSPLVGTYYASPKPDAPAFVEVGDKVKKGQTLCIVEAMKNFNEIESDVSGVVKEICVENSELVEFGKVLFRIDVE